ncbi:MAG TPA: hypothetical protein VM912_21985 [Terriglobales bacterium]|nr:hypothetical protein [Terriglobales bacterium]
MSGLTLQGALMWFSAPVLQLFCVYLLYRRKLLKQFAFFASYLLLLTLLNVVRFLCYRKFGLSSWTYYSAYWVGTALANIAAIAVLYEIFCAAFKPFGGLQDLAKIVFKWAAGSVFFIGFVVFMTNAASPAGTPHHWLSVSVHDFERIVGVMECALLIFLFIGSQHFGLSIKNRVFGFALGFGFDALFRLVIYIAFISSHKSKMPLGSQLIPMGYYAALLFWLGYLLKAEPSRESVHIPVTSPLLRWNEIALQMGHSGGKVALLNPEPFMPQVERIVERVLRKEAVERRRPRYRPEVEQIRED